MAPVEHQSTTCATDCDLLAAAREYVANCPQRSMHDDHHRGCDGPMCRRFRAAIAKAAWRPVHYPGRDASIPAPCAIGHFTDPTDCSHYPNGCQACYDGFPCHDTGAAGCDETRCIHHDGHACAYFTWGSNVR